MKNKLLLDEKAEIDRLFLKTANMLRNADSDEETVALLTYYLVIRISGFVENCVRIIFEAFVSAKTQPQIKNFVKKKLAKFPNPTFENIVSLTKDFDPSWADDFKRRVRRERIRLSSLSSINEQRNKIAHGGNSNITLTELRSYYDDVIKLVTQLEESVASSPAARQTPTSV